MPRLSKESWEAARADYEIKGLSQTAIADKYKVGKSAVSMRAKNEGWIANKTEQQKNEKANAIIKLSEIEQETELNLNRTELIAFDAAVSDEVAFRLQSDKNMAAVEAKAMTLLTMSERPSEVKAIMETLRIHREARLGKSPDTAVQVNVATQPREIKRVIIDPKNPDA